MRDVAVFRQNLFRVSEPFITEQAGHLHRYRPLYLGRRRFGAPQPHSRALALQDGRDWRAWPGIALQMATRDPAPYQRLLGRNRPALIHAHFGTDAVYALPLAERLGIPLVTTFHGFDATLSTAALLTSPAWAAYVFHRRQLAARGDLFLCVSSFIRDRVLALGFPAARTRLHYTGVDCRAITPRNPAQETPTILQVGRLVEMKGTQYALRGFATLARTHPAARLVIIGDGPLRRPLQALAASLELGARVVFLGALPHAQTLDWMRTAAMLVLPSVLTGTGRVEGLGMVLLEAAATGVPAIGSRVGGIPEGIVNGQTGFLVPSRDVAALGRRMAELLDDADLRRRMGRQARDNVGRRFDIDRQCAALEDCYDALLRPPGAHALSPRGGSC